MAVDLQGPDQRRHDNPVPKLTVRPDCWLALFWPYEAAQQRQTTQDAEQVFAGKPACALVVAGREDSYGSDGLCVRC
jgi:hypothetical protein